MSTPQSAGPQAFSLNGAYVAYAHALLAYAAFFTALGVGCWLHYYKIVQNSSFGYPDEWFPSVSAAIGDRYPERSFFQVLIACTSGPRFLLIFLNFVKACPSSASFSGYVLLISGLLRTFTCGGWVYVTSTDDHDWHDISMIGYIVLTIPWTIAVTSMSPKGSVLRTGRALTAIAFFGTLVPLVYWFIQHKVFVRAGAYSIYAYFEWSLILLDVGFDTWSVLDFQDITITVSGTGIQLKTADPVKTVPTVESGNTEKVAIAAKKAESRTIADDFGFAEFLINTINSFMFWSVLTSLLVCVWYFPLWHMGISGWEACVAVMFAAPAVSAVPPFGCLFRRFPQVPKVLTVLLGLGAYKVEVPEQRLSLVTAGVGFGVISLANDIGGLATNAKKMNSWWISFVLGLLGTSVAKHACFSNNPAWPIMNAENGGYNAQFIFVGLASALLSTGYTPGAPAVKKTGGSFVLAALGFGGFLYSLQSYLSDSSTLIFWNWDGYPVTGPTPLTGGVIHLAVFAAGILASLKIHPNSLESPIWTGVSAVSGYVLCAYNGWVGFAGSLGLCFYVALVTPLVGQAIVGYNITALFVASFFVSVVLSLASVWTVAYAFVPGGPLLREKLDLVLGVSIVFVALNVLNYKLRRTASHITRVEVVGARVWGNTLKIVTVLLALSLTTMLHRYPTKPFKSYNAESKSFTAGIWCVHFGLDNDMWSSETRMLNLLREAEVDIVGLLETDTERLIGGNRDFTQKMAHELGMYVDYGPGPNKHTWGAALLSKFPILKSSHHLLPSPVGELAPAILATLDIYGEEVDVVVFHSGQEEDVEDRRLQSLGVQEIMGSSPRPLVLLSYLVTTPLEGNYNTYVSEKSRVYDIDSTDWDRWCEYILFRDLKKVAYARISRSTITDTELQIAKFKFLSEEQRNAGADFLYGNHFIDESRVDANLRMPALFRGDGVRGHRYHVFDEPRYFAERVDQIE